jgi:hypothetical protein
MALIPAICHQCRAVWFLPNNLIHIAEGGRAVVELHGGMWPCPECKRPGEIVSGTYVCTSRSTLATLSNPQHYDILVAALADVGALIARGAEVAEIEAAIAKYPYLDFLKRFLPNDFPQLVLAVTLILATLKSCAGGGEDQAPPELNLPEPVVEALEEIAAKLPPVPPCSQPAQQE